MEKNTILAVTVSALFLMGWYYFFTPKPVPVPVPVSSESVEKLSSSEPTKTAQIRAGSFSPDNKTKNITDKETEKAIDTFSSKVVITSRGAGVKHWHIKESVSGSNSKEEEKWVDLVNVPAEPFPLSTFSNFNFEEVPVSAAVSGETVQSVWRTILTSGVEFEKRYVWDDPARDSHLVRLICSFRNGTNKSAEVDSFSVGWGGGLGTVESEKKENASVSRVLAYPSPTKEVVKFKSGEHKSEYAWAGIDNRYYLFAMLPQLGQFGLLHTEKSKENISEAKLSSQKFQLYPGESKAFELKIYAGPKGYTQLKNLNLGLEHAVDFGYFGFLGKWALKAMYRLYGWTGNNGWAIIILTCFLQILVFPLSLKSYKSMAGMKILQPKIQELQKRYKEDPKRLNQEMLSLYKESKTNPFGGCLPMILQIPIFWAFFTMLRNSYELKGTPWIFWIHDLSQKDPYYVLPIVMGAGMFLQQKISGSMGGDPMQAKMMAFMPVIFTFMFLNFPSGLVLYWLTNSILSMSTQYWCTKKYSGQNASVKPSKA